MQRFSGILLAAIVVVFASSCGGIKNLQYVQGNFDTARLSKIQMVDPLIQKGDLLSISVYSDNASATAAVTNPMSGSTLTPEASNTSASAATLSAPAGFLVSQSGYIQLYKVGPLRVEGMSRKQLEDSLSQFYVRNDLLKNPYVEVRFLNYKITLVGEVTKPGTYSIPTERVNIFEAIGLAGDITNYGRRDNLLVIRESNGERSFARLDLSKPEIFASPYYYLQQNDMVIVDVGKTKSGINNENTLRNITVAASVITTVALIINIFR